MTVDDAAAILDVTEGHVKDLIRDGKLRGVRRVRDRRILSVDGRDVRKRRTMLDRKRRAGR